jgi:hypothetical protein
MTRVVWIAVGVAVALLVPVVGLVGAQGPATPPPSCEDKLDNATYQTGALMQQLAVATAQLRVMTKERDETRAALAKATPKADPKAEVKADPEKK